MSTTIRPLLLVRWLALIFVLMSRTRVSAFDFSYSPPTQCDTLNISWTGGQAPYELLIAPLFNPPLNISIPQSAFDSNTGRGFFQTPLTVPATKKFLLVMSDATGFGSGGISDTLLTGASISNSSCNTTSQTADFFFELNSDLQQCRAFTFGDYVGAVQPATITGLIPLGNFFELLPPVGPTSYNWTANAAAGTSVVFMMTDAKGRTGGSSDLKTVGASDDATCLDKFSPSSTANANPASETAVQSPTASAPGATNAHVSVSQAVVAGSAVAAVVGVASIIAFVFCFLRRRHRNRTQFERPESAFSGRHRNPLLSSRRHHSHSVDLLHDQTLSPITASNLTTPTPIHDMFEPNPFIMPSPSPIGSTSNQSTAGHGRDLAPANTEVVTTPLSAHSRQLSMPTSIMTASTQRKAGLAGTSSHTPSRFILHTDADEATSMTEEDVVELPPQYSEHRAPPPTSRPQLEFKA